MPFEQANVASRRLAGKVAIVTGAASGIGRSSALLFAAAGARVVCADCSSDGCIETVEIATRDGGRASAEAVDVTDRRSTEVLVDKTLSAHSRVDILLHCAGIAGEGGTAATATPEGWDRIIAVNLTGTWLMCRAVLPSMTERKCGSIVTISSSAGVVGTPGIAAYSAAKAGVIGLTRQMAVDLAPCGLRANTICPGTVPTPLVIGAYAARGGLDPGSVGNELARAAKRYPLGRLGTVEEVASMALYLASDEASFVTGAVFVIDGGLSSTGWQVGQ